MPDNPDVGDKIPAFMAYDETGARLRYRDFFGAPFILYFYPKNDTPGCTVEACDFRDHVEEFKKLNVLIIGISPDSQESHRKFKEKHQLPFTLLSDFDHHISILFNLLKKKESSLERTTFICDQDGTIIWIERPVKVEGHVERILNFLRENYKDKR